MQLTLEKSYISGKPVRVDDLGGQLFGGEVQAHKFVITQYEAQSSAETIAITGSVSGTLMASTGATVPLTGSLEDGKAVVVLDEDCYKVPGRFVLTIFVTSGDVTLCIYCGVGNVLRTSTDTVVYPTESLPNLAQLVAQVQAAIDSFPADLTAIQAAIAANYDDLTYPITAGTYAWHAGTLYKAKADIVTTEAWTGAHWETVHAANDLATDISSLKSALDGNNIYQEITEKLNGELHKNAYILNLRKIASSASASEDTNGNRIRLVYWIGPNSYVSVKTTHPGGLYSAIYDTIDKAIASLTNFKEMVSNSYTQGADKFCTNYGFLSVSLKKSDGSTITDAERTELFNALTISIIPNSNSYLTVKATNAYINNGEGFGGKLLTFNLSKEMFVPGQWSRRKLYDVNNSIKGHWAIAKLLPVCEGDYFEATSNKYNLNYGVYQDGGTGSSGWTTDVDITTKTKFYINYTGYLIIELINKEPILESSLDFSATTISIHSSISDKKLFEHYKYDKPKYYQTKDDYLVKLSKIIGSSELHNDDNPTKLCIIYKVYKGTVVSFSYPVENCMLASVYSSMSNAVGSVDNPIQMLTSNIYSNGDFVCEIINDGYLAINLKKADGSVITSNNAVEMFENLSFKIVPNEEFYKVLGLAELYVSPLIPKGYTAGGYSDSTTRMTTDSVVALPKGATEKLFLMVNSNYKVGIRVGAIATNLKDNLHWYNSGNWITIPKGSNYYKITLADSSDHNKNINQSDNYKLRLFYKDSDSVLDDQSIKNAINAMYSMDVPRKVNKYPVIMHTSDCHGDVRRVENFIRYSEALQADAACVTGDVVAYDPTHGIKWFQDIVNRANIPVAVCLGNHDVYKDDYTDADIYTFFFDDMAEKLGMTEEKTWYYKDIADKQIRLISVNLYQYGGNSRWHSHFTNEQLAFLVSALSTTPSGYGIMILAHDSQKQINTARDPNYPEFYQTERVYDTPHRQVNGYPIYDIVDAFINRTTLSQTYTQTGEPASVSVTADFTSVDASVEFIAHLTGHFHQDSVCYVPGTQAKQLMLNVTCTNAVYGGDQYPYLAELSDMGRSKNGAAQDAFNMYVIDRANKKVRIVRIGQTVLYNMTERKYMEIPYADAT